LIYVPANQISIYHPLDAFANSHWLLFAASRPSP